MTHDYSQLFSLFRKGIIKIIGNNEKNSQEGAQTPTSEFGSLFLIILNYLHREIS